MSMYVRMRRADRQTYPALHRAWVRASDLDKAMGVLRAFSLPEVAALGETKRTAGLFCSLDCCHLVVWPV